MDYKVVRTDRKTLALMVRKNGKLEVRAPLHTTEEHIAAFVQAHEDWARKHVARVLDSPPPQTEEDIAALKAQARAVLPGRQPTMGPSWGCSPPPSGSRRPGAATAAAAAGRSFPSPAF